MQQYRKSLPPLDTLVFFECALRCGSFTDAAEELFVSQAAVSKRIRQLEEWLGVRLFDRRSSRLTPTVEARRLGDRVSTTLEFLTQSIEEVRTPSQPMVRLASMSAVGMFWLQPRLQRFALGDAACMFSLTQSDDISLLFSEENDLVVVYGDGAFPGWSATRVLGEELAPVADPAVAERLAARGVLADADAPLLDYHRVSPDWINWDVWGDRLDLALPQDDLRIQCSSYAQSVGYALEGRGVALGSLPLLEQEVATGQLARLQQPSYKGPGGYWLASPKGRKVSQEAENMFRALYRS
ncbi:MULTISPECIES: LysR family transcriptional regulator [Ponticoccus]|uniref:LysR family transcriptional regulator n=1 Tax=Ponticoccus litoralis TaxID=422297 RepID=A0AAW9SSN5_9RHOB